MEKDNILSWILGKKIRIFFLFYKGLPKYSQFLSDYNQDGSARKSSLLFFIVHTKKSNPFLYFSLFYCKKDSVKKKNTVGSQNQPSQCREGDSFWRRVMEATLPLTFIINILVKKSVNLWKFMWISKLFSWQLRFPQRVEGDKTRVVSRWMLKLLYDVCQDENLPLFYLW